MKGGKRSEFGLEWSSEQRVHVLKLDAKGFLPLGFVPQQVHLARFRDAAASMTQTVSSPSLRMLRTLSGITRPRVALKRGQESCGFLPFAVNYLLGFAIDRV